MKVVVAVKAAARLGDEFELRPGATEVEHDSVEWALNEWDQYALEAALALVEAHGGEVAAVSFGGDESEGALRDCLARGADRGVRIDANELDGLDALATARVLAAAIERESADLVLFGVQSSDGGVGATGTAAAAYLGLPRVAVVRGLEYEPDRRVATVRRELEGGVVEVVRLEGPALLTIQTGINAPRHPNLRTIKRAAEKPLEMLTIGELGLDRKVVRATAGARRRELNRPRADAGAEMIDGDAEEVAGRIAAIVSEAMAS